MGVTYWDYQNLGRKEIPGNLVTDDGQYLKEMQNRVVLTKDTIQELIPTAILH